MRTELFGPVVGYIKIVDVFQQPLTYVNSRAEGYKTREEFKEVWRRIYGKWDYSELVWVVEFEYIGENKF